LFFPARFDDAKPSAARRDRNNIIVFVIIIIITYRIIAIVAVDGAHAE
jgi:nitrate reductase NapE component